jgi:hypothetical protein
MKNNIVLNKAKEGIRIGLLAFLIDFIFGLVISIIVNTMFLSQLNQWINGSLSEHVGFSFPTFIRTISFVMNISVFNGGGTIQNGGEFHVGVLLFAIIPIIAFWLADRRENKIKSFSFVEFIVYTCSAVVFATLLMIYSIITRGEILGLEYHFASFRNFIMTGVIVICIQFFISLNYNKTFSPGFKSARLLLRVLLGFSIAIGLIGMVVLMGRYTGNILLMIGAIIVLLPNLAVYIMFTLMGISVQFGEQLTTLMNMAQVDISFTTLSLPIRIGLIVLYFLLLLLVILRMKKERYLRELIWFALSFSFVSFILAYCTTINLGFVKNLLDVQFGINYSLAFGVPFISILLTGLLVLFGRILKKELT